MNVVMDWETAYQRWDQLCGGRERGRLHAYLAGVRAGLRGNDRSGWDWLAAAIADEERKWFVGAVFSRCSLPRRLLPAMIRAAVYEQDASKNRLFVEPCVATYGKERVKSLLRGYIESGTEQEKRGAERALYWVGVGSQSRGFLPQRRT
jgi:hypothetical protein